MRPLRFLTVATFLTAVASGETRAQPLGVDHAWIVVANGAKERTSLEQAGFQIAPTVNRHDGQGTSSVTVEFLNGYLELIYPDPTVRVSPEREAAAEKFRLKSRWRESGYSPIGIVFHRTPTTPATFTFPTWRVSADWMEKGTSIEMLTPRETPKSLSLSISSSREPTSVTNVALAANPKTAGIFKHPNGAQRITAIRVVAPTAEDLPPAADYVAQHGIMKFAVDGQWLLEVTLDNGAKGVVRDMRPALPMIIRF